LELPLISGRVRRHDRESRGGSVVDGNALGLGNNDGRLCVYLENQGATQHKNLLKTAFHSDSACLKTKAKESKNQEKTVRAGKLPGGRLN
jgi:hypothetical protein